MSDNTIKDTDNPAPENTETQDNPVIPENAETPENIENHSSRESQSSQKPGKPWYVTALKILGWTLAAILLIFIVVCTLIVWILTPAKLTPMVEEYATDFLNAEVKIDRVELSFWSTFPQMTLEVDNLDVVSNAFDSISAEEQILMPEDAKKLLHLGGFHGSINLPSLFVGKISLSGVTFDSPSINLVKLNDNFANYDIMPASADTTQTEESAALVIPDIAIDRFAIINANPIRYRSVSDSLDVAVDIKTILFEGTEAPLYKLGVKANGTTPIIRDFNLDSISVVLNGNIEWKSAEPLAVALRDFTLGLDSIRADFSTLLSFADSLVVKDFSLELPEIDVNYLLRRLPGEYTALAKGLDTDMTVTATASLQQPYVVADSIVALPLIAGTVEIPACHIRQGDLQFNKVEIAADYAFNGENIDKSTVELKKLVIDGKALDVNLKGTVRNPISDPAIKGKLNARFSIDDMPRKIWQSIAAHISGNIEADMTVDMRMSDLSPNHFHRLKINGDVDLNNFNFLSSDSVTNIYANKSCLKFGSNRKIQNDVRTVDSLLTVTVEIDTAHIDYFTTKIDLKDFKSGLGTRVTREKLDSTTIVPFGGTLAFKRLKIYDPVDSIRLRLKDIKTFASLKRFEGDKHAPQLTFAIDAKSISAGIKKEFAVGLKGGHFDITSNLRKRKNAAKAQSDSTKTRRARRQVAAVADEDDIDLSVDSGLKAIIKNWDIKGKLTAESGRFYTYAVPVKNRLKNIDLSFNLDSITLRDLYYRMGNSEFVINGNIGNLRRVLLGRKRNNALKIDFDVNADTVDINEISRLLFTETTGSGDVAADLTKLESGDAGDIEISKEQQDTAPLVAFMVPGNIDADIRLKAKNVIYTDLMLRDFSCQALVRNKVVNLRNLYALTDAGSLDFSALYSTMDRDSIQFGMGMKITSLKLEQLNSFIPAIDTLMPMLKDFSGIINADIAAASQIDTAMNFVMPSLQAAIKLSGDSLVLLDPDTFKMLSKWLIFKNKNRNMIDHLSVELTVEDNQLQIYPFLFDIDRYRLGVMGTNDLAMNLNYHISVLKSPLPFKFGINIKGNIDDMKIRLGGAKFKENATAQKVSIADTTRINLINEIENIFRRSARTPIRLNRKNVDVSSQVAENETISHSDSLLMIKEGYIEKPDTATITATDAK